MGVGGATSSSPRRAEEDARLLTLKRWLRANVARALGQPRSANRGCCSLVVGSSLMPARLPTLLSMAGWWRLTLDVLSARLLVWLVSLGRDVELTPEAHAYFYDRYTRLAAGGLGAVWTLDDTTRRTASRTPRTTATWTRNPIMGNWTQRRAWRPDPWTVQPHVLRWGADVAAG